MKRKKIVCIIGTRPQLIKHSVLLKTLKTSFLIETVNTQQHYSYELNNLLHKELFNGDVFFKLDLQYDLEPAIRLGEMISKIGLFLQSSKPDAVLVYGDTDSTLAGALASKKSNHYLIHVEAGERSGNMEMPEEHNRIITDALSDLLFCSSSFAMKMLKSTNINKPIIYSGDIMKDLLHEKAISIVQRPFEDEYIFCTIHRNYNQKNPFKLIELLNALNSMSYKVIFPIHPSTLKAMQDCGAIFDPYSFIQFVSPLSYIESIRYQKFAKVIVTDSGGIQREAYWLKRPCITIRKETEWKATLSGNWNQLLYEDLSILPEIIKIQPDKDTYNTDLYGSGNACTIIKNNLLSLLN